MRFFKKTNSVNIPINLYIQTDNNTLLKDLEPDYSTRIEDLIEISSSEYFYFFNTGNVKCNSHLSIVNLIKNEQFLDLDNNYYLSDTLYSTIEKLRVWDLYKIYNENLKKLIKNKVVKYEWMSIDEIQNLINMDAFTSDSSLNKILNWFKGYQENQENWSIPSNLSKDVLKKGTFTPFFFIKENNILDISIGRHRLYSLIEENKIKTITRKFLCISLDMDTPSENELFKDLDLVFLDRKYVSISPNMDSLKKENVLRILPIKNYIDLIKFLIITGDSMSNWISTSSFQVLPSSFFNNENDFYKWIESPLKDIEIDSNYFLDKKEN